MAKTRNRKRPALSFQERLKFSADQARSAAHDMPPGAERDLLVRKALESEAAANYRGTCHSIRPSPAGTVQPGSRQGLYPTVRQSASRLRAPDPAGRHRESAAFIEPVGFAGQDGREIEAEAVDAHFGGPVAQRIGDHLQHALVRKVDGVSGAGVVNVVAFLVGRQPVVARIVDALEGQRRPQLVAFGSVVVDHVENHLDAVGVKLIHHFLELARRRRAQVARLRREEAKRVIAPVTAQALVHQIAVVDKGMDGQKLRTGNAERAQIYGHVRTGEAGKGAAVGLRDQWMKLGKTLHMHFVDDRAPPRRFRLWRASPGEGGIDHAAFLHERRAVARVEGFVLVGVIEPVAEQFRAPAQLATSCFA